LRSAALHDVNTAQLRNVKQLAPGARHKHAREVLRHCPPVKVPSEDSDALHNGKRREIQHREDPCAPPLTSKSSALVIATQSTCTT